MDVGNLALEYVQNSKSIDYEDGKEEDACGIALCRNFEDRKLNNGIDPDVWIS